MAKKRKAGSWSAKSAAPPDRSVSESRVKLNIQSYEDVADSEDEFYLGQDKVLLDEGPDRKRLRKLAEEDAFLEPSDEEVLDVPSSEAEEELSDDQDGGEDVEQGVGLAANGASSEEEDGGEPEEDVDREGWGSSKKDYYNADAIETEADALEEEQEALRLQKKQLQSLKESDYGLDEFEWKEGVADGSMQGTSAGTVREILPPLEIKDSMTEEERQHILATRYPEFEPLANEFLVLQHTHEELSRAAQDALDVRARRKSAAEEADAPVAVIKRNAASAYLGSLAMYLALFTSDASSGGDSKLAKPPAEMRDHPVMESLVYTRALWERVKDTPLPTQEEESDDEGADERTDGVILPATPIPGPTTNGDVAPRKKKHRKSKAQKVAEEALAKEQAKKAERLARIEAELAELSAPVVFTKGPKTDVGPLGSVEDDSSDFGDAEALTAEEAEAKAKRKRGLRFYTSQITQKSMKRDRTSREAGGDTDIPHRERLRDRQERLNAEAEARGQKQQHAAVELGGDSDDEDRKARRDLKEGDGEDYYGYVAAQTKKKRASKEALVAAQREAAAMGNASVHQIEQIGPDGKRAITYAIQKNKGLTPKRSKAVRNPRVKKRLRYEDKKKKLGSIRQLYKGGEGRGGYGGEATGIKKNLVKSVKL